MMAVVQGGLIRLILRALGERMTVVYGLAFNFCAFLAIALVTEGGVALALIPVRILRIARYRHDKCRDPWSHGLLYGALVMLGKIPEAVGARRYLRARARRETARIIEYK